MSTYALTRTVGSERRYWRQDFDAQGIWTTRDLATRWHKRSLAEVQKADLIHDLAHGPGYRDRQEDINGLISARVVTIRAKATVAPVDLDTVWAEVMGRLDVDACRWLRIEAYCNGVLVADVIDSAGGGATRVGRAESLSGLLLSLGVEPITEQP